MRGCCHDMVLPCEGTALGGCFHMKDATSVCGKPLRVAVFCSFKPMFTGVYYRALTICEYFFFLEMYTQLRTLHEHPPRCIIALVCFIYIYVNCSILFIRSSTSCIYEYLFISMLCSEFRDYDLSK